MKKTLSTLAATASVLALAVPAGAANKTVKVADDYFTAKTVTINKGNTVTWRWVGTSAHWVQFKGFRSPTRGKGYVWKHTFRKSGTFRYNCPIHTGMNGKVVVR